MRFYCTSTGPIGGFNCEVLLYYFSVSQVLAKLSQVPDNACGICNCSVSLQCYTDVLRKEKTCPNGHHYGVCVCTIILFKPFTIFPFIPPHSNVVNCNVALGNTL